VLFGFCRRFGWFFFRFGTTGLLSRRDITGGARVPTAAHHLRDAGTLDGVAGAGERLSYERRYNGRNDTSERRADQGSLEAEHRGGRRCGHCGNG
jgi:hypothetical protein